MNVPRSGNTEVLAEIFQRIQDSRKGSIPFSEFMETALYHPGRGYYREPEPAKIGREGDFFTSVSVGDCFGGLMGWEIERRWRENFGSPDMFHIVEQGAHDGQLAIDILRGLENRDSALAGNICYAVIEPSAGRRRILAERFEAEPDLAARVEIFSSATEISHACGTFLCNELLDAFPVERIRFEGGLWKELRVRADNDGDLAWVPSDIHETSRLAGETGRLGDEFPEGYTTEVCLGIHDWVRSVGSLFERGLWWILDYGFEEAEYYSPHRADGTLRCYRGHRATDNPFEVPGEMDLTAHVDFTRLFREAREAGLEKVLFVDQHDFLTRAALPWLTGMEKEGTAQSPENRKRIRQFQTLTHPGMMGRVFKVAEFSRGL